MTNKATVDLEDEAQRLLESDDYWINQKTQRRMCVIMDTLDRVGSTWLADKTGTGQ